MKFFLKYLKSHKKMLGLTFFLAAINQIFSLLDPQIFRLLVDNYASKFDTLSSTEFFSGVGLLLAGTIGVALVSRIAKNFQDYYTNKISQQAGAEMYQDSLSLSLRMPFSVFEDERSGELLSKIDNARTKSGAFLTTFINIFFIPLVGVVFVISYAMYVHWSIGLIYALMIPILSFVTYRISKAIKNYQKSITALSADLAGNATETLRNIELVKSLGLEAQEISHLTDSNQKILKLELQKIVHTRKLSFIQGTLINLLRTLLMLVLLYLIYTARISLGEFFSLLFYSFFLFNPLAELGNLAVSYQETKGSLEKLEEALRQPVEKIPEGAVDIDKIESINFEKVSFNYPDGKRALHDIQFSLKSGNTIALAGLSGSGKTTITKLLLGLYHPTNGKISINKTSLQKINLPLFRKRVGLVTQESQLFAGTIRENLRFVKPDATDAEMFFVIKSASAENLLTKSEKGLDTIIGEGGIKLSGGEKQRLAIARSLLRDPMILIFDEATSALDSITEQGIIKTIQNIKLSRPEIVIVIVAHRLSTIKYADTIYILEKGKITESGTHEKLLEEKGLYYAMWRQQQAA